MQEGYLSIKKGGDSSHQESCQEYHLQLMRIKSVGVSAQSTPPLHHQPPPSASQNFLFLPVGETHCIFKVSSQGGMWGMLRAGPAALLTGEADLSSAGAGSSWAVVGGWLGLSDRGGMKGWHISPPCHTTHMHTLIHMCLLLLPPFLGV